MGLTRDDAERAIAQLLDGPAAGRTICPSEAARALGGDDGFRPLMPLVREAAGAMAARGELEVTQRGDVVDVAAARGPIRLRRPCNGSDPVHDAGQTPCTTVDRATGQTPCTTPDPVHDARLRRPGASS